MYTTIDGDGEQEAQVGERTLKRRRIPSEEHIHGAGQHFFRERAILSTASPSDNALLQVEPTASRKASGPYERYFARHRIFLELATTSQGVSCPLVDLKVDLRR